MIAPITIASIEFLVLAGVLAGAVRRLPRHTATLMLLGGIILLGSWLTWPTAALWLAAFLPVLVVLPLLRTSSDSARRRVTTIFIAWEIFCLAATKYEASAEAFGVAGTVGLSYLVFRQIHLVIFFDPLRSPTERRASYIGAYLVNPWVLLAGPIQTFDSHVEGLTEISRPNAHGTVRALSRMATGALKVLVIATLFRGRWDLDSLNNQSAFIERALVFYAYYVFLFFDFSGYMDIVLGAAALAGFRTLPENFDRPYLSANVQEFWTRWHITLGAWFRDHVFTPMATSLMRRGAPQDAAVAFSLFTIFTLIGLWHGLAINFIVFGLIHATLVTANFLGRRLALRWLGKRELRRYDENRWLRLVRIVLCQHAVAASFMILANPLASIPRLWGGL